MSQYLKVRAELAKQREADRRQREKLPPRRPPPAGFKAELERIKAELKAKEQQ